jgi:hypothetical protein
VVFFAGALGYGCSSRFRSGEVGFFPPCFCSICYGPVSIRSVLFPQIRNYFHSVFVCYVGFVLFLFDLFLFCSRSICFHIIKFVFRSLSVLFLFGGFFVSRSSVVSGDDSFLKFLFLSYFVRLWIMLQCFGS